MNHLTRRGSERGAVAPMAALCLLVVLAMTSYALDLGASWLAKQRLTTASDAAVLAVARTHAAGGDCTTEAAAILHANLASGTVVTCTTSPPAIGATMVQVTSKVDVPFHFAQSMGYSSGAAHVTSSARVGTPKSVTVGTRPLAICVNGNDQLSAWLADPTAPSTIQVSYGKTNTSACNDGSNVPGNWGTVDFNGGSNSNHEFRSWVQYGYNGPVNAGSTGADCTSDPTACYQGDTGALAGSSANALQSLVDAATVFPVPLFDSASGNGANTLLHVVGFALVQLTDYQVTGANTGRYLTFTFQPGVVTGTCCTSTAVGGALCDAATAEGLHVANPLWGT